jgi:hypothetical protein
MADYFVAMADYRAAVSAIVASFASVRVSEPTVWPSMVLCPVSLALPLPGIIPTPPPMGDGFTFCGQFCLRHYRLRRYGEIFHHCWLKL